MSAVDVWGDKRRAAMAQRLAPIYDDAMAEVNGLIDRYYKGWDEDGIHHKGMYERIAEEKRKFDMGAYNPQYLISKAQKNGVDLEKMWYYKKWKNGTLTDMDFFERYVMAQEARGKYFEALQDQIAHDIVTTNEKAYAYINGQKPLAYVKASNEVLDQCKQAAKEQGVNFSFSLVNEDKLSAVMDSNFGKKPWAEGKWSKSKDAAWNQKKVQDVVYRAIRTGKSAKQLAEDFETVIGMNKRAAMRNARTAMTDAITAGKQNRLEELGELGAISMKVWVDVHDSMPPERKWHWEASGQRVRYDEPFYVGGEYLTRPGDPHGSPENIENCRCRMEALGWRFVSNLEDDTFGQSRKANIRIRHG